MVQRYLRVCEEIKICGVGLGGGGGWEKGEGKMYRWNVVRTQRIKYATKEDEGDSGGGEQDRGRGTGRKWHRTRVEKSR